MENAADDVPASAPKALPCAPAAQPCATTGGGDADAHVLPQKQVDHLHQVFVTKNAVLCSEVKKNFQVSINIHSSIYPLPSVSLPCSISSSFWRLRRKLYMFSRI